jgi:hypothetical protein
VITSDVLSRVYHQVIQGVPLETAMASVGHKHDLGGSAADFDPLLKEMIRRVEAGEKWTFVAPDILEGPPNLRVETFTGKVDNS